MKITFGFAPRMLHVTSEKEYVTIIAALQNYVLRPTRLVLSNSEVSPDDARETAESLIGTLQED